MFVVVRELLLVRFRRVVLGVARRADVMLAMFLRGGGRLAVTEPAVSGSVRVLDTRSLTSADPMGDPRPVAVLAPALDEDVPVLPLLIVVVASHGERRPDEGPEYAARKSDSLLCGRHGVIVGRRGRIERGQGLCGAVQARQRLSARRPGRRSR